MKPEFDISSAKILVTGGYGFLGSFVIKELLKRGAKKRNIFTFKKSEVDLRKKYNCIRATRGMDVIIHLAGNVGGIGKNQKLPGELFYDNAVMGIELIEAARKNNVGKFVCIGTVCAYPKLSPTPFQEKNLWDGYPEETNAPYGLAKKMLLVQGQAYRKQYGMNFIYLLPVNLYGPGDNFNPDNSHVIPALIKKFMDAKKGKKGAIDVWGDGSPTREFLYVEDAAEAIVRAALYYNQDHPVNIGTGKEISIKKLVEEIAGIIEFHGKIRWDTAKPNGQPRRKLDTTLAKKYFGFSAKTDFQKGLRETIKWYKGNC
ncbi:MAG: GDP-L-fucose synthase family protein [Candidatus Levyibacteriota bacterium]